MSNEYTQDVAEALNRINDRLDENSASINRRFDELQRELPEKYVSQQALIAAVTNINTNIQLEVAKAQAIHDALSQRMDLEGQKSKAERDKLWSDHQTEMVTIKSQIDGIEKTANRAEHALVWAARIVIGIVLCALIGSVVMTHGFTFGY